MTYTLNPDVLDIWKHWIIERNRIFIRKEIDKKPFPWTDDPILREYRFTNVKRWQDRESRWLIESILSNKALSLEDKIYNCILFRSWNKSKTFELFCGKGLTKNQLLLDSIEGYEAIYDSYSESHPDYVWFTNAFNTGGIKQSWKYPGKLYHFTQRREVREGFDDPVTRIPVRMIYMLQDCINKDLANRILRCPSAERVYKTLREIRGCCSCLA